MAVRRRYDAIKGPIVDGNGRPTPVFSQLLAQSFSEIEVNTEVLGDVSGKLPVEPTAGNVLIVSENGGIKDSAKALPDGDFVGTEGAQELSEKTLISPVINDPVLTGLTGTFTLSATPTTDVANTHVTATSHISITDLNAAASVLMASTKRLRVSARNAGVGFTVATQDGTGGAGTEEFSYSIMN